MHTRNRNPLGKSPWLEIGRRSNYPHCRAALKEPMGGGEPAPSPAGAASLRTPPAAREEEAAAPPPGRPRHAGTARPAARHSQTTKQTDSHLNTSQMDEARHVAGLVVRLQRGTHRRHWQAPARSVPTSICRIGPSDRPNVLLRLLAPPCWRGCS